MKSIAISMLSYEKGTEDETADSEVVATSILLIFQSGNEEVEIFLVILND